jgi:hypothetical protein
MARETFTAPVTYPNVGSSREVRECNPTAGSRTTSRSTTRLAGRSVTKWVDGWQQNLSFEDSRLPPYLNRLIDELRKRDK